MRTSIVALAAALRQPDEPSAAATGEAPEKTYAREADGDNRPSTPEETVALAEAEEAAASELTSADDPEFGSKRLSEMTGPEMLELQHEMVATAVDLGMAGSDIVARKVWRNKADGVRTCLALHKRILEARAGRPAPEPIQVGRRRTREPSRQPEVNKAEQPEETTVGAAAKKTGSRKAAKSKAKTTERKAAASPRKRAGGEEFEAKVIVRKATENPYRAGTMSHDYWKYHKEGQTVAGYLKKFGEDRARGMNWLRYEVKRGFIKLQNA